MKTMRVIWMLLLFVGTCFPVAGTGAIIAGRSVSAWYSALLKPAWNPPSWIFGRMNQLSGQEKITILGGQFPQRSNVCSR
jgi:hypothetical protein